MAGILAEVPQDQQCPRNPGGGHMMKPVALDPGRYCCYCARPDDDAAAAKAAGAATAGGS